MIEFTQLENYILGLLSLQQILSREILFSELDEAYSFAEIDKAVNNLAARGLAKIEKYPFTIRGDYGLSLTDKGDAHTLDAYGSSALLITNLRERIGPIYAKEYAKLHGLAIDMVDMCIARLKRAYLIEATRCIDDPLDTVITLRDETTRFSLGKSQPQKRTVEPIDWEKVQRALELAANLWVEQVNEAMQKIVDALAPAVEDAYEALKTVELTDDELKEVIRIQEKELEALKKKLEVLENQRRVERAFRGKSE